MQLFLANIQHFTDFVNREKNFVSELIAVCRTPYPFREKLKLVYGPVVFQLFLKLTELQMIKKTIVLLFLNNTFLLKYCSEALQ